MALRRNRVVDLWASETEREQITKGARRHAVQLPSREAARQTAEHYLSAVPGFRDHPCTYEITEKSVIGTAGPSQTVHMIWGCDEDADGNETGIWSSGCYTDEQDAQRALDEARQRMKKQMWSLDAYRIGQCHWREGFVRLAAQRNSFCFPGGSQDFGARVWSRFWMSKCSAGCAMHWPGRAAEWWRK